MAGPGTQLSLPLWQFLMASGGKMSICVSVHV